VVNQGILLSHKKEWSLSFGFWILINIYTYVFLRMLSFCTLLPYVNFTQWGGFIMPCPQMLAMYTDQWSNALFSLSLPSLYQSPLFFLILAFVCHCFLLVFTNERKYVVLFLQGSLTSGNMISSYTHFQANCKISLFFMSE
jgi:hypothetical protein